MSKENINTSKQNNKTFIKKKKSSRKAKRISKTIIKLPNKRRRI